MSYEVCNTSFDSEGVRKLKTVNRVDWGPKQPRLEYRDTALRRYTRQLSQNYFDVLVVFFLGLYLLNGRFPQVLLSDPWLGWRLCVHERDFRGI